jgi:hypothetical protein
MGNARLLTMNGDGHTAFREGSDCIDSYVTAYVITLQLPPVGTQCDQNVPFPLTATAQARSSAGVQHRYTGRLTAPLRPAR